ncbi:hypothetical protein CAEBREN_03307 [Caenorhabditis brenneri]|uniref:Uncharacterized protein n=1 Tax=Caenorhabditis brenneri TaxID=135651 RepID=G0PBG8_CAEBE|nr:hypothetical protein CAEBREN_03307 [Caenorhabditis brenneri]
MARPRRSKKKSTAAPPAPPAPPPATPPPVEEPLVDIEPDLSTAVLVCSRPRLIKHTVTVDTLTDVEVRRKEKRLRAARNENKKKKPEVPTHLEHVRDAVFTHKQSILMRMYYRRPDAVTPVVDHYCWGTWDKVTYLYNLDHDRRPITGKRRKEEYGEKYLTGEITAARERLKAEQEEEQEKRDAKFKAEREAKMKLRRGPCDCDGSRPGH